MSVVGAIGDTHIPHVHPLYMEFCLETFDREGVDRTVHIGDVCDFHAISFHEHDPDGDSAGAEALAAFPVVQEWYSAFPRAKVCIGNHDERIARAAKKIGLSRLFIKDLSDVWKTKKWDWDTHFIIDGVLYVHGTGSSGKDAAINLAIQRRMSAVQGHTHIFAGVKFHANDNSIIFGMNTGCGIDRRSWAFNYGRDFVNKPVLGCGVVKHGAQPIFFPMPCAAGERFHSSRAGKSRNRR